MYDGAADLQGLDSAAAQRRRVVAAAALIATAISGNAAAEPAAESLRPALTHRGWQLELSGWVQADVIPWSQDSLDELDPSTGVPLNEERFLIRRSRLRGEARRDGVSVGVELDGNTVDGPVARILAAHVGYAYPAKGPPLVALTAGLFRTPFGMEVRMSERIKPFIEPPAFARALFPGNYDAGAMAHGEYGLARWSVAVVNGAPPFDAQWRGRDPVSSFELVGRLGAEVEGPYRSRFAAGVSALTGRALSPGTPPTKEDIQWVDENQDGIVQGTEIRVVPGTVGTPSQTFERDAIGVDLQVHWHVCGVGNGWGFAEGVLATNLDRALIYADPIAATRDQRHLGFAIGVVQDLGPHVQLGARFDRYDADRDAAERQGIMLVTTEQVFQTIGVMATARWAEARFMAQYDHETNPFGRGDDGAPTTRRADRVTLRAQVGF